MDWMFFHFRQSFRTNDSVFAKTTKLPKQTHFVEIGNAEVTLSGIELANKIKKGQFDTSEITNPGAMILHVW